MSIEEKNADANVIFADFPDLDIIRVENTYYMVSTTMHFMPGCVILRSYNLVDWEIASYVYENLDLTPGQKLEDNKGIYGQGMWAACLRYHKGKFYVCFVANDTHKTYLYTSESITGPWKKSLISGFYHDMSILFDDDGKVYCVSGNTDIRLVELKQDLSGPKEGGIDKIIITDTSERILGYEGSHIYKINGKYYIFFIHWPKGKFRTEACYVCDKIDGEYKGTDVLNSDIGNWESGVAQGGIVDSPDGKWYGMLFQDHGALGRIPVLVPVTFENDFPVFGITENGKQTAPQKLKVLDLCPDYKYAPLWNDKFTDLKGKLLNTWQWNHSPNTNLVELSENTFSITTDKLVKNVCQASNTLTQRPVGHKIDISVKIDASSINEGDYAGVCALEGDYGFIAVTKIDGEYKLVTGGRTGDFNPFSIGTIDEGFSGFFSEQVCSSKLSLGVKFNFLKEEQSAIFYYSNDNSAGKNTAGPVKKLRFTLDQFTGCRFALFMYSTKETGGKVVFSSVKNEIYS